MQYSAFGASMIEKARYFAHAAHGAIDQKRANGTAYIIHPEQVAKIVSDLPNHTWRQVVVAWLHDVVEDTKITNATIEWMFDSLIASDLRYLTNVEKSAGNRATRHKLNVERLSRSPAHVATVKVADIFCNVSESGDLDPSFRALFLTEKVAVMHALRHADQTLWLMTMGLIDLKLKEIADAKAQA